MDVGFSATKKTTCFCLLSWDTSAVSVEFRVTGSAPTERAKAIAELVMGRHLSGVALDGPLAHGLAVVRHYRVAEAVLSRGPLQRRGKPGQSSAPTGRKLHDHATELANLVLASATIAAATHWQPIHPLRLVEAFPNSFLAALVPEQELPVLKRDASDKYWEVLVEKSDRLEKLMRRLLPERNPTFALRRCTDHEERAGLVCALTALSVAAGEHVAVGDAIDGDIMLPHPSAWGADLQYIGSWLEPVLRTNVAAAKSARRAHVNHRNGRVATAGGPWFQ